MMLRIYLSNQPEYQSLAARLSTYLARHGARIKSAVDGPVPTITAIGGASVCAFLGTPEWLCTTSHALRDLGIALGADKKVVVFVPELSGAAELEDLKQTSTLLSFDQIWNLTAAIDDAFDLEPLQRAATETA